MSRRTRERRLEASERWPNLQRFLESCFHEGWLKEYGSVEAAMAHAIGNTELEALQDVVREWCNWNATCSWKPDGMDFLSDEFGMACDFEEVGDARRFMSRVYDKLIVAIRAKAGKGWRPDAGPVKAENRHG